MELSGVLSAWGLGGAEVSPWTGGTANRNYLVVHEGQRYLLRHRSPRYVDPAQIAFDHALMERMAWCGVLGPNPIPADGQGVVRDGEDVYELHRFVAGVPVDWHSLDHLRMAARALRRFHDATAGWMPPAVKDWPRDDAPERIRRGLAELREVVGETDPRRAVLDRLEEWTGRIEEALPAAAYSALPCQVIHGDFHPGNVTVAGDEVALFDLDCASRQPRARDLADGILYFCARRDGPFDASNIVRLTRECWIEPERNRVFLDAYGAIGKEEEAALPWLVAARWIYSRVHGRRKLPREEWADYATRGVLTPLEDLKV